MIDTDKYEGHTPAPWAITNDGIVGVTEPKDVTLHVFSGCYSETDAQLIADAPLLLAEVIRLREEKTFLWETYLKESAEVKRLRKMVDDYKAIMERI